LVKSYKLVILNKNLFYDNRKNQKRSDYPAATKCGY
jgi:hypothetical protein